MMIKQFFCFLFLMGLINVFQAQESIDSSAFSLEGAIELFKKSNSLDEFEKALNTENNSVNNLDLNNDNEVDYIRVNDIIKDSTHVVVLQAILNENEFQDVATINIERTDKENAILQIIGDEDIYNQEIMVEPKDYITDPNPASAEKKSSEVVVNVWAWPAVKYMYTPVYKPYVSPWKWAYYPAWRKPFKPSPTIVFYKRHHVYRPFYRKATVYRVYKAKAVYQPVRHRSVIVKRRSGVIVKPAGRPNRKLHHNRGHR